MSLAIANNLFINIYSFDIYPGHPFWMPLAIANNLFINIYSFDILVSVITQYSNIHDKAFHKLTL
jgi:hypothetical protein